MQTRAPAPSDLKWWRPAAIAPDLNGPVDIPFQPLDRGVLDRPILHLLTAIAARQPRATAIRDADRSLDFAGLRQQVLGLAARIAEAVPRDQAVGILMADGIELATAMLACIAAGRVCLMISVQYPAERVRTILDDAAAGGVVVPAEPAGWDLPAGIRAIPMQETPAGDAQLAATDPDAPALVIYTSGSTGRPKGIVRSQRQVLYLGWNQVRRFHLNPGDRVLSPYTLTTGGGLVSFMMTLCAGAAFHPMNVPAVGARAVLEAARRERITLLTGTPSLLRVLFALDDGGGAFASLRALYTTGEWLLAADLDAWRRALRDDCAISFNYGMGEAGALGGWFPPKGWGDGQARLPAGHLNADYEYAIGEDGALWVRSPLLSAGEWQGGRCVPGRLLADPADDRNQVLCTGDSVRLRDDGLLDLLGRVDAQVKLRGNRVEPAELENLLLRSDGVAEAAVVVRGSGEDLALAAFVVPRAATAGLQEALLRRVREALPSYMHPAELRLVERLPRTPTGKVDLRALDALRQEAPRPRWRQWLRGG
ncbi:MAG: AMP-binding protein [Acetobacteraceae bacterium]